MTDQEPTASDAAPQAPASRALVVITQPVRARSEERPLAGFLTQLIACERRLPAYRPARMADPAFAASTYLERDLAPAFTLDRDA